MLAFVFLAAGVRRPRQRGPAHPGATKPRQRGARGHVPCRRDTPCGKSIGIRKEDVGMNAAKERSVSFLRRPSMGGTREAGSKLELALKTGAGMPPLQGAQGFREVKTVTYIQKSQAKGSRY